MPVVGCFLMIVFIIVVHTQLHVMSFGILLKIFSILWNCTIVRFIRMSGPCVRDVGRIPSFLLFAVFCLVLKTALENELEKLIFEGHNFKNGFYKFSVLSKSMSEQKIMSSEQFLGESLNFKGCTYF